MALKNMFGSFNGSSGRRDFTEADLPDNRIDLFRAVFSVRKGSLIGLNLLYLVFWIPAIFLSLMTVAQAILIITESTGEAMEELLALLHTYFLLMAPLIALTGPFNAAVSYIARNWARDEHSFIWMDFKDALKKNRKQGLLFGIINGLVPLLVFFCTNFYMQYAQQNRFYYLPLCMTLVFGILWAMCALLIPTLIVTYKLRFIDILRNALLMAGATLPLAFGIVLLTSAFPILLVVSYIFIPGIFQYVCLVSVLFYILIGLSFNKLVVASYANMVCEKYLNPQISGARTNIGLRPEKKADEHE